MFPGLTTCPANFLTPRLFPATFPMFDEVAAADTFDISFSSQII
jgi:hypothetical protein